MSFNFASDVFGNGVGDSVLILGDIVFQHLEIPPRFNFGGEQLMKVHQLIGGAREVNALGRADADITFSGLYFGTEGAERARAVDYMRVRGTQVELVFGEFVYLVLIREFAPSFERYYQVYYTLTVTVINDLTMPVPVPVPANYNSGINNDFQFVASIVGAVDSPALTGAVGALGSSIADAGNLATASAAQLLAITDNISACQIINNNLIAGNTFK